MPCRNCGCNLEDEFRYCPRCGAPTSLGWPAAGGPWLRRPAAVGVLALLVIAWLAALQRQLWISGRSPAGSPLPRSAQLAERPPAAFPASSDARSVRRTSPPALMTSHPRQWRPVTPRAERPAPRWVVSRQDRAPSIARVPPAAQVRTTIIARRRLVPHRDPNPAARTRRLGLPVAALPERESRDFAARTLPDHGARHYSRSRVSRRAADPWSRPPVIVQSPGRLIDEPVISSSNLVVNISARPYGVKTFVYVDGGRELGMAPVRVQFDRPGRHHFLFFAPSLGVHGRVNKVIEVRPQRRQWVSVTMGPSREFARRSSD